MSRFKVRFGDPEPGWMNVALLDNDVDLISFTASHIYYPSLSSLTLALLTMRDPRGQSLVHWMLEPAEVEMIFSKIDEAVTLEITRYPDDARPLEESVADLTFTGSYNEVCLPFWRALRNLEGRYAPEELAMRWESPFPHHDLAVLTERLGKS